MGLVEMNPMPFRFKMSEPEKIGFKKTEFLFLNYF